MAKILVIEDDQELQNVLQSLLSSEGHEVTAASSGEEALEKAALSDYDLVIADIRMEGMSGLDAIEQVKQKDQDVKSLVITGYASEEDSIRAVSLGVEAYLKKPFSLDSFLDAVNEAVRGIEQEKLAAKQRQALSASFEWSLAVMSRMVEQTPDAPDLSRLKPMVESFCAKLGVGEDLRATSMVTALYLGLRETLAVHSQEEPPFSQTVKRALESLDEYFDGSGEPAALKGEEIPLETRIAQVSHAAVREASGESRPGAWLAEQYPGRFDPNLLMLLDQHQTESKFEDNIHVQRNLLSLGRAYEGAGNYGSARQAYQQVMKHQKNRFSLDASLALIKLTASDGREPARKILMLVEQALNLAEHVGAAPFGWSAIELSLILERFELKEKALDVLAQAQKSFDSLKLEVGSSAAQLTSHLLLGDLDWSVLLPHLDQVLKSNFGERLQSLLHRLTPVLLNTDDSRLEEISLRLCRDYPEMMVELLSQKQLEVVARQRLAKTQGQYILPHREAILDRLATDEDESVRALAESARTSEEGERSVPSLRVLSLGPLSVFRGGRRIQETQWRSQKVKYLLAMLAAAGDQPVSDDKIIESFWPDSQKKGRNCLYWTTSALRSALSVEGMEMDPVLKTSSGLQLNPDIPLWHDLHHFEKLSALVRQGSTAAYNIEEYLQVLDLYRGPYLEGGYFDWIIADRNRLEVHATELLNRFVEWTLQKNRFNNSLDYALRLTEIDPSSDEAHVSVMKAYLGMKKPKDALSHFDRAKALLWNEYEQEPSIALIEQQQRALLASD